MSLEQAIISLVVEGVELFEAKNDKVQVDLTATERAAKNAEDATATMKREAQEAEKAARALQGQITKTLSRLAAAAGLADRLATALGFDESSKIGQGIDVAKDVIGGAAQGAALGGSIGSVVPVLGTAAGAIAGTVIGGGIGLAEGIAKLDKKLDRLAGQGQHGRNEIENALVAESVRARIDHAAGGGGRQVQ